LLTFKDGSGNIVASLIVGRPGQSGASKNSPGQYVRKSGSNDTYLTNRGLELSVRSTDWIETGLLNIADDRIMETTITHTDGATVSLLREQGEENFTVTNLPEGMVSRSFYFTNQPGTFLSDLSINNASARSAFTFPETHAQTTIKTYDGLVASITSANVDGVNYAAIDFSVDEARIEASAGGESEAIVIGEPGTEPTDVRKEASELHNKVANWVFIISTPKYLLLTKHPDELMDNKTPQTTE
jgi:hypothetical protein